MDIAALLSIDSVVEPGQLLGMSIVRIHTKSTVAFLAELLCVCTGLIGTDSKCQAKVI